MAMEITNNYGSYAARSMAESSTANGAKKKETEKTTETAESGKAKNTADYANGLAKLVPSVEFRIGNSFSTAKSGKTLTINPQLLEKMQNDPETEKEMKELIKGVESAVNMLDSIMNASGWSVVFKHDYIDENGKYRQIALVRNDYMLNMSDKLREERREISEKLFERIKEKAAEKEEKLEEALAERKEELEETLEEEKAVNQDETTTPNKVEQLLEEKIADSKDGAIYLYDTDIKTIIEAAKEDSVGKANTKQPAGVGANLDLQA